jgi:hypothetical protein
MIHTWVLDESTENADGIGNIRLGGNGEIEELTNQLSIGVPPHPQPPLQCLW